MKVHYKDEVTDRPSKIAFAYDIPILGMPFKCEVITDEGRIEVLTSDVELITVVAKDTYRVQTKDCIYIIMLVS